MAGSARAGLLLAVDVGTSGARAAAFDLDGQRLLEARRGYPTRAPRPGWAEQDGRAWRSAAIGALGDLIRRLDGGGLGRAAEVRAIGLTGQCPSIVLVDRRGEPVSAGLIYRDNRATSQADAIRDRYGDVAIHRRTGHLPSGFHIAPKLLWLREHEPKQFAAAAMALQPRDLVALALTGEAATDGTHAAATLAYDLRQRGWDVGLLDELGLDASLFPPIGRSDRIVGGLRPSVAARVGLPAGTPVVLGGADSQACALGVAVVNPGPVSEMAGSSTCLNAAVLKPLEVLAVTHYPHVVPGPYTTETGINTTGAAVAWLAGLLYGGRSGRPTSADFARLDAEAGLVAAGAHGVIALPVLGDGERTDPDLRGAFVGLSLRHDRGVLARAVLEGVAFAIADQLDLLRAGEAPVTELRVSGGDTRLATWTRIKADALGIPVRTVPGDAAVTGVAMLAGLGAGIYRDPAEAIERCVRLSPATEPDVRTRPAYAQARAAYRGLADFGRGPGAGHADQGRLTMHVRLGIDTCFAVKRWPRVEDWAPIVRDRLGLRLVQHSFDLVPAGSSTTAARALGGSIRDAGLELHSTFTGLAAYSDNLLLHPDATGRAAAADWFEWAIDWTAAAGGHATGGHVGAFSVADWTDPERHERLWSGLRRTLDGLAARARTAGLDYLLVENLAAAREPSTMAMIRDLMTSGDDARVPVRLCLDVGHMCVPGTSGDDRDPYAWLRDLGPVAPVVQLQQSDAAGDHHWPFTPANNAVGRVDADRVLAALAEGGVEATDLILEVIPPFEQDDPNVLDDLEASVDHWRAALARAGLTGRT